MSEIKLIESNGGPLICLESELASSWCGTDELSVADSTGSAASDYDRACAIKGYTGIVNLWRGAALILGDMPLMTNVWHSELGETYIARWFYCESDNDDIATLTAATSLSFDNPIESIDFTIGSTPMIIFDSACRSDEIGTITDSLSFEMAPGRYRILTKKMDPDKSTSFLLHKFCRLD